MRPSRRRRSWNPARIVAGLGAVSLCACGSASSGAALPPKPLTITVEMADYRFVHPHSLPRGRVVMRVRNTGHQVHRLLLVPLPPGFPSMADEIRQPSGMVVSPLAGIPNRRPGAVAPLAVDLTAPGRYGFFCFVVDPDNRSHISKGMASEFTVR